MSKKRRTRAQKQKIGEHRRQQFLRAETGIAIDGGRPILGTSDVKKATIKSSKTGVISSQKSWNPLQRRSLQLSLLLLGMIIIFQLGLWLIFHLSVVDTKLYNLIKL